VTRGHDDPTLRLIFFFLFSSCLLISLSAHAEADAPMSPPRPPTASLHGFLDAHFTSPEDLAAAPALAELLRRECAELEASLRRLEAHLASASASWLARSADARSDLRRLKFPGSLP
jgi:hypothetical protein